MGLAFRAYGSPQSFMGSDIAIDCLAAKMGIDPFEMRAMNCYKASEHTTIPTGYAPDVYCEGGALRQGSSAVRGGQEACRGEECRLRRAL